MLQHLSSLRVSVGPFAPVYHPWVRNLSKQDRWVIYVDGRGDPKSVAFVGAADAKYLVTVARDNFSSFPAFKGRSLPLGFASQLLEIYTDGGPMARLLSSVSKIDDPDRWWSEVDKLIHRGAVEEKYKQTECFVLDVSGGDSAIQASMRAPLSETLFAREAASGAGEYETDTAPRPNLRVVGLCYLISRNAEIPSLMRYGMEGLHSYPVHKQSAREMAACLEWITKEERRGKTWQSVPGKDRNSPDLLIVHVSGDPDVQVRLADFFGDLEAPDEDREPYYAVLCESITRFFVNDSSLNLEQVAAFVLSKPGPRLVVLNTVNNAAVLANYLWQRKVDTLHLSTALTPYDRTGILQKILDRLRREPDRDWVLVATSCIEAGMDFSFRSGFREMASLNSLVQTGGRVNRNTTWEAAELWSVRLADGKFTQNPAFLTSQQVLASCIGAHSKWAELSEMSTDVLQREFTMQPSIAAAANTLVQFEKSMDYPAVAAGYEVITDQRSTVVIDQDIAVGIRSGEPVRWQEVQLHSVQLRDKLIADLGLQQIADSGLYDWQNREYDPDLLGYMVALL